MYVIYLVNTVLLHSVKNVNKAISYCVSWKTMALSFDCVKGVFEGSGLIDYEQTFEMFSEVFATRQLLWL